MRQPHASTPTGLIALLAVLSVILVGCPKQPEMDQTGAGAVRPRIAAPVSPPASAPAGPRAAEVSVTRPALPAETVMRPTPPTATPLPGPRGVAIPAPSLRDIFFDFDESAIRDDQRALLNENAAWLKANVGTRIILEGYCDERGTAEYNLGLGERRAKAVRDFLVAAGISAARITTVSYGEERPFVLGHDESAWQWNRRVHFSRAGP